MLSRYRTQRNAAASPLLRLPGELRNRIYEFIFEDITFEIKHSAYIPTQSPNPRPVHNLALLQTCRQIHSEAKVLPLVLRTICFRDMTGLNRLVRSLATDQRCAITSLRYKLISGRVNSTKMTEYNLMRYLTIHLPWWGLNMHKMPVLPGLKRLHVQVGPQSTYHWISQQSRPRVGPGGWRWTQFERRRLDRHWNNLKRLLERRYPRARVTWNRP